jgi:hypothetical protein
MRNKLKQLLFFTLLIFEISSCKNKEIDSSFFDEEIISLLNEIEKVNMYIIDSSVIYFESSSIDSKMITEDEIRDEGDLFTFYPYYSQQGFFIVALLLSASPVNINLENNIGAIKQDDITYKRKGIVIDIISKYEGGDYTFIMQDGLDVFYEKKEPGKYFRMPKIILDKYIINEEEFYASIKKKKVGERRNVFITPRKQEE